MVANTKDDFASRLNSACDNAPIPLPEGRGRRAELRRRLEKGGLIVSGESVRKWLSGESIPTMDNLRFIALALGCNTDWLLTGREFKQEATLRVVATAEEERASYLDPEISREAMEIALYYDRLPAAIRAELRATIVKTLIDFRLKYPTADLGNITDLLRNF